MGTYTKISTGDIKKMQEMRAQGMSNAEIARKIGCSDKTVFNHIGNSNGYSPNTKHTKGFRVSEQDILEMQKLRENGLSNKQISIELGVGEQTIVRHIGYQPNGNRSAYGSIVSHADGESFAPSGFMPCSARVEAEEKQETQKTVEEMYNAALELAKNRNDDQKKHSYISVTSSITTYKGQVAEYTVNSNGKIEMQFNVGQSEKKSFDINTFNLFLEELMDLVDKIPQNKGE